MRIWVSRMIRAALTTVLLPALAQADPWETFESYCLTPMLATQSPVTDAFEWIHEDDEIDVHQLEMPPLILTVNIYKYGTFSPVGCEMHLEDVSQWDAVAAGFASWRAVALDNQAFELSEDGGSILSTDQREPRIQVFLVGPDQVPRPFVAVEETYLES